MSAVQVIFLTSRVGDGYDAGLHEVLEGSALAQAEAMRPLEPQVGHVVPNCRIGTECPRVSPSSFHSPCRSPTVESSEPSTTAQSKRPRKDNLLLAGPFLQGRGGPESINSSADTCPPFAVAELAEDSVSCARK